MTEAVRKSALTATEEAREKRETALRLKMECIKLRKFQADMLLDEIRELETQIHKTIDKLDGMEDVEKMKKLVRDMVKARKLVKEKHEMVIALSERMEELHTQARGIKYEINVINNPYCGARILQTDI